MTKEELKKEAEDCMHNALFWLKLPISKESVKEGGSYILKLLEPREKQIEELEEQNTNLQQAIKWANERGNEYARQIADLEDKLANADFQLEGRDNEIKELKEQIEKMINEIDKIMVLSNMQECEICNIQDIFRKYGFRRNSNDTWEIKEND